MTHDPVDLAALSEIGDRMLRSLAYAIASGRVCSQCHSDFSGEHGHKVACPYCFGRMTSEEIEQEGVRLATLEESATTTAKKIARQRRQHRRQSNGLGEA